MVSVALAALLGTAFSSLMGNMPCVFLMVYLVTHRKYGMAISKNALHYFLIQLPLFIGMIATTQLCNGGIVYWLSGGACVLLSTIVSYYFFGKLSIIPKPVSHIAGKIMKIFRSK